MNRAGRLNFRFVAFWGGLFLVGLLLRLLGLLFNGIHDLDQIVLEWGADVHQRGLAHTPIVIYGLLSYVFHGLAFDLALWMPRFWWAPQKFFEIGFEIGIFWALISLLPKAKRRLVMYLYWLNPWFILHGAWQGFWDGPHTLAAFLAVLAVRSIRDERYGWGAAGAILAIGALFKPQGLIYFLVPLGFYLGWQWLIRRHFGFLLSYGLGALAIFVGASAIYGLIGGNPLQIPHSYLIGDVQPNLCNGCIGPWRPVTNLIMYFTGQTGATYELQLPDKLRKALDLSILAATVALVVIFALRVTLLGDPSELYLPARIKQFAQPLLRRWQGVSSIESSVTIAPYISAYLVLTFAGLVIPQLGTRAHINHTYAGLVLLIPLAIISQPIFIAWLSMIIIHFYGHLSSYQLGRSTAMPTRDVSRYPPIITNVLNRIDPNSYPRILNFQRQANDLIGVYLPVEPILSWLSIIQFVAVLVVVWQLFTRLGQVWKLADS